MKNDQKLAEVERLLEELKAEERGGAKEPGGFFRIGRLIASVWTKWVLALAAILIALVVALPLLTAWSLKGSTLVEQKNAVVMQVQSLNELATAQAYTKVVLRRESNRLFGQEIGVDFPGTKQQLLLVVPGMVKAGVDFSKVEDRDVRLDEQAKTARVVLPRPALLSGADLYLDKTEVYAVDGALSGGTRAAEAFALADEAKVRMREEAVGQGLLRAAEANAKKSVENVFRLAGYQAEVTFK